MRPIARRRLQINTGKVKTFQNLALLPTDRDTSVLKLVLDAEKEAIYLPDLVVAFRKSALETLRHPVFDLDSELESLIEYVQRAIDGFWADPDSPALSRCFFSALEDYWGAQSRSPDYSLRLAWYPFYDWVQQVWLPRKKRKLVFPLPSLSANYHPHAIDALQWLVQLGYELDDIQSMFHSNIVLTPSTLQLRDRSLFSDRMHRVFSTTLTALYKRNNPKFPLFPFLPKVAIPLSRPELQRLCAFTPEDCARNAEEYLQANPKASLDLNLYQGTTHLKLVAKKTLKTRTPILRDDLDDIVVEPPVTSPMQLIRPQLPAWMQEQQQHALMRQALAPPIEQTIEQAVPPAPTQPHQPLLDAQDVCEAHPVASVAPIAPVATPVEMPMPVPVSVPATESPEPEPVVTVLPTPTWDDLDEIETPPAESFQFDLKPFQPIPEALGERLRAMYEKPAKEVHVKPARPRATGWNVTPVLPVVPPPENVVETSGVEDESTLD